MWSFWWFRDPCHLLVLVDCDLSHLTNTRKFQPSLWWKALCTRSWHLPTLTKCQRNTLHQISVIYKTLGCEFNIIVFFLGLLAVDKQLFGVYYLLQLVRGKSQSGNIVQVFLKWLWLCQFLQQRGELFMLVYFNFNTELHIEHRYYYSIVSFSDILLLRNFYVYTIKVMCTTILLRSARKL